MPPSLTVRAFAEMLELPLYEQLRILEEQKYPRRMPTPYRIPYYQPALAAIREFYRSGGRTQVLQHAIADIQASTMTAAKKRNNIRVIQAFHQSSQARRRLTLTPRTRATTTFHGVILKYVPDLIAQDGGRSKHIFYNVRQAPVTAGIAGTTLEIAHLVLTRASAQVPLADLELVDLAARGKVYRIRQARQRTIKRAGQNARAIVQIWQGI